MRGRYGVKYKPSFFFVSSATRVLAHTLSPLMLTLMTNECSNLSYSQNLTPNYSSKSNSNECMHERRESACAQKWVAKLPKKNERLLLNDTHTRCSVKLIATVSMFYGEKFIWNFFYRQFYVSSIHH